MSKTRGSLIGLAMTFWCLMCSAQKETVPIRQINEEARLSASTSAQAIEAAVRRSFEMEGASSSAASFVFVPPRNRIPRTVNTKFFVLNGLHLGMAIFDVEMTQHCLAVHHCIEGNPLMPCSAAGQLGVNLAIVGLGSIASYRLKKDDNKLWILSPTVGIIAHTLGVATGIAHR